MTLFCPQQAPRLHWVCALEAGASVQIVLEMYCNKHCIHLQTTSLTDHTGTTLALHEASQSPAFQRAHGFCPEQTCHFLVPSRHTDSTVLKHSPLSQYLAYNTCRCLTDQWSSWCISSQPLPSSVGTACTLSVQNPGGASGHMPVTQMQQSRLPSLVLPTTAALWPPWL